MNIGMTIRSLREKKGLNQNDFANACQLSQSYLSLIEKGKKEPTLAILKEISSNLSLPMPVLVFLSLDVDDVPKNKQEAYRILEPSIKSMLRDVFTTT